MARKAASLDEAFAHKWESVIELLSIPRRKLPAEVHVYVHIDPADIPTAIGVRAIEEKMPLAVVDILVQRPILGALVRLACSLAI